MTAFHVNLLKCVKVCCVKVLPLFSIWWLNKKKIKDAWSGGINSTVFKSMKRNILDNFRGNTILPIIKTVFEAISATCICYQGLCFTRQIRYNNVLKRKSDNILVPTGLVKRQVIIDNCLYVCIIYFSKAFVMGTRTILFYKLIFNG